MDIEISDALKAKIEIYNSFVQEAEKYREEYTEFFFNCSSTESVVRSSRSEAFGYYNAMAQKILNILAANNIYTYTKDSILSVKGHYLIDDEIGRIKDKLQAIDNERQNEIAYRQYKKDTRTRFVGGGFGVKGAMKGIAMAETANALTGMASSVGNAFGNAGSNSRYRSRVKSFYSNSNCKKLADAVYYDCLGFYNVMDCLLVDNGFRSQSILENIKKADSIFTNLKNNSIPKANMKSAIVEMLRIFPAKEEYYNFICAKFGDEDGTLQKCMEQLSVNTEKFLMIKASYDWKQGIFGDYLDAIVKHNNKIYCAYLAHLNYEIIYYLEAGLDHAMWVYLSYCVDQLKEEAKNCSPVYLFENNKCGNVFQILKSRGVTFEEYEVPLMCIETNAEFLKMLNTTEYLVLTTNRLIFCADKSTKSIDIMKVKSIFVGNKIEINSEEYCTQNKFSNNDKCEQLEYFLWDMTAVLQCLHTVGMNPKNVPIITQTTNGAYNDDISFFFSNNILLDLNNYDLKQEFADSVCKNKGIISPKNRSKIYGQTRDFINALNADEEFLMYLTNEYYVTLVLTDKNLYVKPKEKQLIVYPIGTESVMYYDFSYNEAAFFFKDIGKVSMGSGSKKENIMNSEFCDNYYYITAALLEERKLNPQGQTDNTQRTVETDNEKIKNAAVKEQAKHIIDGFTTPQEFLGYKEILMNNGISEETANELKSFVEKKIVKTYSKEYEQYQKYNEAAKFTDGDKAACIFWMVVGTIAMGFIGIFGIIGWFIGIGGIWMGSVSKKQREECQQGKDFIEIFIQNGFEFSNNT